MNPRYPLVSARARHVCEYCRAPEIVFNLPFEVEHIRPLARGGESGDENLALSCQADFVEAVDELTQQEVGLFNPRRDAWNGHFSLAEESGEILGLSASGRATVSRLRMNGKPQVAARRQWLRPGLIYRG